MTTYRSAPQTLRRFGARTRIQRDDRISGAYSSSSASYMAVRRLIHMVPPLVGGDCAVPRIVSLGVV